MNILKRSRIIGTADAKWKRTLRSAADTARLGHLIGESLRGGEVLALDGLVGSGKTTLVRGIAEGLKADPRKVASPTFVFIHEYRGRLPLVHADLYRVRSEAEAASTGLEEYFDDTTVTAVEWADRAPRALPHDRLEISLEHRTPRTRFASFRALGPASGALLETVRTRYEPRSLTTRRSQGKAHSAMRRGLSS
jgi:tRNA threonylcarbamoyladenosine biosynthesis protein TsaE